jgi:hypothetical protein
MSKFFMKMTNQKIYQAKLKLMIKTTILKNPVRHEVKLHVKILHKNIKSIDIKKI